MKITFLGTGTSQGVPMIACDCLICKSTDVRDKRLRSSLWIQEGSTSIVIDTGPDFRYQMLRADVQKLDAILLTHEHKDHIAGLDDIRAFNYVQQSPIDVYAHLRVQKALKREFKYIFDGPDVIGIPKINLHSISKKNNFSIHGITIVPIEALHYKLPVLGFRINDCTYITDAKTISVLEKKKIIGSKVLIINALQNEPHFSHFTLNEAIALSEEINPTMTFLTHVSHRMGKYVDIQKQLPPNVFLAYDGMSFTV